MTIRASTGAFGVGLATSSAFPLRGICDFEAHPRWVEWPSTNPGPGSRVRWPRRAGDTAIADDLLGQTGPLEDRSVAGAGHWKRSIGTVTLTLDGGGAVVPAAPPAVSKIRQVALGLVGPQGRRVAYTLPWGTADERGASLGVELVPPGTDRGQGQRGRGGLVFWQDADNWVLAATWLDDSYDGTSISTFYRLLDHEELYDAVWTNVGRRVSWGVPYRLDVEPRGRCPRRVPRRSADPLPCLERRGAPARPVPDSPCRHREQLGVRRRHRDPLPALRRPPGRAGVASRKGLSRPRRLRPPNA